MDETELWMMRTDMRLQLQEVLLLHLQIMVPLLTGKVRNVDASLRQTFDVLDQLARSADQIFTTGSKLRATNDAQRAQCADEMRELIGAVKKQAEFVASGITFDPK